LTFVKVKDFILETRPKSYEMHHPRMNPKASLLGLLCLVAAAPTASAALVVSNLGEASNGIASVGSDGYWAQRFVTDNSAPGFTLDSVTLAMHNAVSATGDFFVAIYSESGGIPLASLGTLFGNASPILTGQHTYISFPGGPLSPNTGYWVVAGVSPGAGGYHWKTTASDNSTGSWTIPGTASFSFSSDQGASWEGASSSSSFMMSLEATPVPEVEGWGLMTAGLASLGILWRRRRAA
jgi:hypothetical protein